MLVYGDESSYRFARQLISLQTQASWPFSVIHPRRPAPRSLKTDMRLTGIFRLILFLVVSAAAFGAGTDDVTYVLRPNDTIRLAVYEEPDLSVQVRILKTGQASFPLIGSVEIGGLSVSAAAAKIRELYAKDYLVDPKLTLTVDEYATEFISVIGAVRNPGQIPMPVSGQLDLASAMATAGGLAETADANSIQLVRASGTTSTYSMAAIQGEAGRVKLGPGDRHHRQPERLCREDRLGARPGRQARSLAFPGQWPA